MSEMEYNKGTLIKVTSDVENFVRQLGEKTDMKGMCFDFEDMSECIDFLQYFYDEKYQVINNKVYLVDFEIRRGDLDQISNVQQVSPVEYKFETYHYNGGGHWTDLVSRELLKAKEEK